ncbi:MAG TPA: aminotransferase class I/II-fold pyridoxal phosphate-dependent enzyme [Pseudonocardiaceae bacterium]|nr:aminotransferase class I/II-fold pyridoxal phosphate-dependent enzyme [Pseudonocardiaceae bacterium]
MTNELEDGQLIAVILDAAGRITAELRGRNPKEALADAASRTALRRQAIELTMAAGEVSEMMRNWATHIPWDRLAGTEESDLVGFLEFLDKELPVIRPELEQMWEPAYTSAPDPDEEYALEKSSYDFYRPVGRNLLDRTEEYYGWIQARRRTKTWQCSRVLEEAPGSHATITDDSGRRSVGINFNSQDYLSLNTHPAVREAALRAMHEFGPHSAGSAMVLGNTRISNELEAVLADLVQLEHVTLFSTGWAAGFGSITGLVRQDDHIVIDRFAHACLQQGARAATRNIVRYDHLSVQAVGDHLRRIREHDARNGILVVTDGLFSVDADWPDVAALQELCHAFDATLLVDVAHDLGAMGPGGTGVLGIQDLVGKVDLVMGAFSKTFASNGGFLAARTPAVKQYVKMFAGSHMFSNALSAMQTAVVLKAAEIVRSPEGQALRGQLFDAVHALRDELTSQGLTCMGEPSPIVPVLIGNDKLARTVSRILFDRGVHAFMVEFPATPTGAARFRMQVQATHKPDEAREAARIVAGALADARAHLASAFGYHLT